MESSEAATTNSGGHATPRKDQRFHVVYDPRFDRFFLEDEALHQDRSRTLDRKDISIPWGKWILPPKSPPKSEQPHEANVLQQVEDPPTIDSVPPPTIADKPPPTANGASSGDLDSNDRAQVPALDFSSFQQPLAEASADNPTETPLEPSAANKPRRTRIQDYNAHFRRTNQDVAKVMVAAADNADPSDEHEVKWNGEVIRVQVSGLQPTTKSCAPKGTDALKPELLRGSAEKQWPGSTYELKDLMRIRAHGDGLRGVNSANRFVAVSSSESSDSEQEQEAPPQQECEEESELMPVFFRDDRVLFHARRRWFKGTVRRRIPRSDFYNVRADNGTLFEAVLASKMELLDEPKEVPYYHYTRGDKVLWIPDSSEEPFASNSTTTTSRHNRKGRQRSKNSDEELTYKAKIVQVRSLDQFDVLLRTGRVVKKVPYEQLRPQDASEFVSTTTSRRR